MFREELENRETGIVNTLSSLPKRFILIGGYATSALASHRFSVDCDIVISRKDAMEFRVRLRKEGYIKKKATAGFDKTYGGTVEIYTKKTRAGNISVDLFIDSVASRSTRASWSYEYVRSNSTEAVVSGLRTSANVLTPTKELLIAMKIHSGRDADIRDAVMLCEDIDWAKVAEHAARGEKEKLLEQLTRIISRIDEARFSSSLRVAFELRGKVEPLISVCKKGLSKLKESIQSARLGLDNKRII